MKRKIDRDEKLKDWIVDRLKKEGWSPDVIAGKLRLSPPSQLDGITISHEAIYAWLYEGEGHTSGYWQYLPTKRKRRRKRGSRKTQTKTTISGRMSIHARDEGINERMEVGHWESDSVIYRGSGKQRLSVQTERKARYTMIHRLPSGKARDTLEALRETVGSVPQDKIKTITFDNGGEGALHQTLTHEYNIQTYFCDPLPPTRKARWRT